MSDGHFGKASHHLAIVCGVALLLHLLLPYGIVDFRGPAAPDNDWLSRGETMDHAGDYSGRVLAGATPAVTLAGLVLATTAAGLLLFLGYQPLSVVAARWVGAGCSTVAGIGLAMAWTSSFYSIGTGFATFLGTLFGTQFVANFWALSPVIVAALSGWGLWTVVQIATRVIASRDGLRDDAARALRLGLGALAFMAVVLLVPWSIGLVPDGISDALFLDLPDDDPAPLWLSAEDVQSVTPAEAHPEGRLRFVDGFGMLNVALHVFMAFGWTTVASGWLRALLATATSAGAPRRIHHAGRLTIVPITALLAVTLIFYVLAWILVTPKDATQTFLPGFFPILVLAPLAWLARDVLPALQGLGGQAIQATD